MKIIKFTKKQSYDEKQLVQIYYFAITILLLCMYLGKALSSPEVLKGSHSAPVCVSSFLRAFNLVLTELENSEGKYFIYLQV